jgi:hypothetical protein
MNKTIFCFGRDYQADLYTKLDYADYNPLFITLTLEEKKIIKDKGFKVIGCFEEDYFNIIESKFEPSYLDTSFFSDRFLGELNLNDRNLLLQKSISFWAKLFETYKPIAVLNEVIAIEFSEVMHIEARKRNIKYLAWLVSPFKEKFFYWLSSPYHASLDSHIFSSKPSKVSIEKSKEYCDSIIRCEDGQPFYSTNQKSRKNFTRLLVFIKLLFLEYYKRCKISDKIKKIAVVFNNVSFYKEQIKLYFNSFVYKYVSINDIIKYEIVFYPLHYEPEASIIYFSEFYEDQAALIRNLSKCLNNNQLLVVKEHPQQPGMLLSKKYRTLKNKLSNVEYLPSEFKTKKLIELSTIIITQTSTAGWEALFFNKPVVVIGKVFYDKYEKINRFEGFSKLRQNIKNSNLKVSDQKSIINYAAKMYEYCCFGNPYFFKGIYDQVNIDKLSNEVVLKLNSLSKPNVQKH